MSNKQPLYNSKVTRNYLDYLRKNFPDINIDSILEKAEIASYEVEDSAHWFTQNQQDRFSGNIRITCRGNQNFM